MRIGAFGLGRIGVMHARNLAQTAGVDEVVLIGRDAGRLAAAEATVRDALAVGAPPALAGAHAPAGPTAAITTTLEPLDQVLTTLDGIVVATSTISHQELALKVARARVPLLIEKPLSLTSRALADLSARIEETGTPVMVAFHRRYDPGYQELARRVAAGELGTIRAARAVDNDHHALPLAYIPESRGLWFDLLIHDFDITHHVLGDTVVAVQAFGSVLDEPVYAENADADTAVAVLEFASGALVTMLATRKNGAGQDCRLEVFGTDGTAGAGVDASTPVVSTEAGTAAPVVHDTYQERFEPAFRNEVAHFVRVIRGEAVSLTPPSAGIEATRIAEAAAESFSTGRRVTLK